MIIVRVIELALALLFTIFGIATYLSTIREITYNYESHRSDLCPPGSVVYYGLSLGLFAFTTISWILLVFLGGKVLSIILLMISAALAVLFSISLFSSEGEQAMAAFGCAIPPIEVAMLATMELFQPNVAGFGLILAFYALIVLILYGTSKMKAIHQATNEERPQRRCDYDED